MNRSTAAADVAAAFFLLERMHDVERIAVQIRLTGKATGMSLLLVQAVRAGFDAAQLATPKPHSVWVNTLDRVTRRWAHDVQDVLVQWDSLTMQQSLRTGSALGPDVADALTHYLSDVNAERQAVGLRSLTAEDI